MGVGEPELGRRHQPIRHAVADLVDHTVARVVLDLKHIVITLKSAGENSSEPIEVPWSAQKDARACSD